MVFPTETVYGLGANAFDEAACRAVFEAKGRPQDNPLIVHLPDIAALDRLFPRLDRRARLLFDAFSPGPLSIVVPRSAAREPIARSATAGLDTVAIRIPRHPVAARLLRAAGVPVAAPSANRSGRPSPTTFEMARADMEGRVAAIIDGGNCEIGLESTVIDLRGEQPIVLRHGVITPEMVAELLGEAAPAQTAASGTEGDVAPRAPGMKYTHYKPKAEVIAADRSWAARIASGGELPEDLAPAGGRRGLVGTIRIEGDASEGDPEEWSGRYVEAVNGRLSVSVRDLPQYGRDLYRLLVWFDAQGVDLIVAELPPEEGTGYALRDRLLKASGGIVLE